MKKIAIATMTVAFAVSGVVLPLAANAAAHPAAQQHHKHALKNAPCTGLGIDIALGSTNICIPL